jgi:hypothetical protein
MYESNTSHFCGNMLGFMPSRVRNKGGMAAYGDKEKKAPSPDGRPLVWAMAWAQRRRASRLAGGDGTPRRAGGAAAGGGRRQGPWKSPRRVQV